MSAEKIDIGKFKRDTQFYGEIDLLLTIKSFDLQAIRQRYIKSKENLSGRAGSVQRREVSLGGIASVRLVNSQVANSTVLTQLPEPRGIDVKGGLLAISSENIVYLISENGVEEINNEWFSYIHTVDISADQSKILISSSGFDCVFEYDLSSKDQTSEWFAWEHGFNKGIDPETGQDLLLTRNETEADQYEAAGLIHLLITKPATQVLPTAKRAAFINSVTYDNSNPGNVLGTFFHKGTVNSIDLKAGASTPILSDLVNPHGGRNYGKGYLATSTATGEIVLGNGSVQQRLSAANLPGKPSFLEDLEWMQNTVTINSLLIAIDSNRTSFIVIDPEEGMYDIIPYDSDWAVQDAVVGQLSEEQKTLIKQLA